MIVDVFVYIKLNKCGFWYNSFVIENTIQNGVGN